MWGRRSSSASADAQAGASDTIELQEARCTGMYQKALRAQGQGTARFQAAAGGG